MLVVIVIAACTSTIIGDVAANATLYGMMVLLRIPMVRSIVNGHDRIQTAATCFEYHIPFGVVVMFRKFKVKNFGKMPENVRS